MSNSPAALVCLLAGLPLLAACSGDGQSGATQVGGTTSHAGTSGFTTGGATAAGGSANGGVSQGGAAVGGTASGAGGALGAGTSAGGSEASAGASTVGGTGTGGVAGAGGATATGTWNEGTELKAFPTAEGYGRYAKGGRGGKVIEVTNLNDSGAGSLRAAIEATGPRTVVFRVGGTIALKSKLLINGTLMNSQVTVAGQTAPGKGIAVTGYAFGMSGGEQVIFRFIRTRIGGASMTAMDGMGMRSANNAIYDHCSISWTIDEAFSSREALNITLQRSLISECLNESYHYDDSTDDHTGTQAHGFAASISGDVGSFHHNLTAHCAGRNWSLAGGLIHGTITYKGRLDIRNNVFYNWNNRTTDGGAHEVNFVNNYYKPGAASKIFTALNPTNDGFEGTQRYYMAGNVMPGYFDEMSQAKGQNPNGKPFPYEPFVDEPFFDSYVKTQTAEDAYTDVLGNVGVNVPMLDDHDKRVIDETRKGTYKYKGSKTGLPGLPDDEADVGGLENYPQETRPADWDTDHDGMPNAWETAHGLDSSSAADGNATTLSKLGYTNLEMYLNELAGDFK